jgi:acetyltransferase-like isoleucine patch superfamily enzyme
MLDRLFNASHRWALCWRGALATRLAPGLRAATGLRIGRGSIPQLRNGGRATLGEKVSLARGCQVVVRGGTLTIGDRTEIMQGSVIAARQEVRIGADCLIAEYVTIRDQDHRFGPGLITAQAGFETAPVVIGNNVWIGAKATVLRGVTIGEGAVIGAHAVVTQDIPAGAVAVGVPARVIG